MRDLYAAAAEALGRPGPNATRARSRDRPGARRRLVQALLRRIGSARDPRDARRWRPLAVQSSSPAENGGGPRSSPRRSTWSCHVTGAVAGFSRWPHRRRAPSRNRSEFLSRSTTRVRALRRRARRPAGRAPPALPGRTLRVPIGLARPERAAFLTFAATLPEARGSGAGLALTEHVLAWAHEHGYPDDVADWRMTNLLASRFWPKRGFRRTFLRLYRSLPDAHSAPRRLADRRRQRGRRRRRARPAAAARAGRGRRRRGARLAALPARGRAARGARASRRPRDGRRSSRRRNRFRSRRSIRAGRARRGDRRARAVGRSVERPTILVAGGLARRTAEREVDQFVPPEFARRFRGSVEVHDAESPDLVPLADRRTATCASIPRSSRRISSHGQRRRDRPPRRAGACSSARPTPRRSARPTRTRCSRPRRRTGWQLGVRARARAPPHASPSSASSLVLNTPRARRDAARLSVRRGVGRTARPLARAPPLRRCFPASCAGALLQPIPACERLGAVFSGPPSVAHAEALLRGTEERARSLGEPLDAVCLGIPGTTPYLPRERPNPLLAAYLGLGLALRLWRDAFPVVDGGTAILAHPFEPPVRAPEPAAVPQLLPGDPRRHGREPRAISPEAERWPPPTSRSDRRLPRAAHAPSAAPVRRLERVRARARTPRRRARRRLPRPRRRAALGFVPTHGVGAALQMAQGRADRPLRIGFLLAPPVLPLACRPRLT